jgi:hypothetical protein
MFTVWLRSMDDLQTFEVLLVTQFPELTITVRTPILWHMKLGGHILDPQGRNIRAVPMSLWPEQTAIAAENTLLNHMRQAPVTP